MCVCAYVIVLHSVYPLRSNVLGTLVVYTYSHSQHYICTRNPPCSLFPPQASPQRVTGTSVPMRSPASESGSEGRLCDYEGVEMNNSSSDCDSEDDDMYVNGMNSRKDSRKCTQPEISNKVFIFFCIIVLRFCTCVVSVYCGCASQTSLKWERYLWVKTQIVLGIYPANRLMVM